MPHHANVAITAWLGDNPAGQPMQGIDSLSLLTCIDGLHEDSVGLYYSGLISFVDAMASLNTGSYSWSTVKLYYSCFYALRSVLASNGIAIFYRAQNPYSLRLVPGAVPKRENGVTHKIVWNVFKREFGNNSLLGDIDGDPAYQWMTTIREYANYKACKFYDPTSPSHFSFVESAGLRPALMQYVADHSFLYTFDADHAAIAYPLECLRRARDGVIRIGKALDAADRQHLLTCADRLTLGDFIRGSF